MIKAGILRGLLFAGLTNISQPAAAGLAELKLTDTKDPGSIFLLAQEVTIDVQKTSTTIEYNLTYKSNYNKETQGTFYFALPANSFVQEFGYWVGDTYQKASVVKAREGRMAYEAQVRRGIDPALVEWTAGNNFKMRVYPIFPDKSFKVRILVTAPISSTKGIFSTNIPLAIEKVSTFSLKITGTTETGQAPVVKGISGLKFAKMTKNTEQRNLQFIGKYSAGDFLPPDAITLIWKAAPTKSNTMSLRRYDEGRTRYFEARFTPELTPAKLPDANRAVVFWDHSLSEEHQHAERLELLTQYFADRQPKILELHSFSNTARKIIEIENPDLNKIQAELSKIPYDGGTRIDIATDHFRKVLAAPLNKNSDVLVFTNGIDSFELYDFKRLKGITNPENNTFIIAPHTDANTALLQQMAVGMTGTLLSLGNSNKDAFIYKPWRLASLSTSKSMLEFELPGNKNFYPGDEVVIRGQIKKDGMLKAHAKFTRGKESKKVSVFASSIKTNRESTPELARIWAKARIDRLLPKKRHHQESISELGQSHQLLTPYTVMVVLETCEDYREFDLTPPDNCLKRRARRQSLVIDECPEEDCGELINNDNDDDDIDEGDTEIDAVAAEAPAKSENFFQESPPSGDVAWDSSGPSTFQNEDGENLAEDIDNVEEEDDLDYINVDSKGATRTNIARSYGFESTLRSAASGGVQILYATYLKQRQVFRNIPYFYLLTAQLMTGISQPALGNLIASNVTEIRPGEARWLTVYAYQLLEWGRAKDAIPIFKTVTELREEDPAGFRDLGIALEQYNQPLAAFSLYEKVASEAWDSRLDQIKKVINFDLARVARKVLTVPGITASIRAKAGKYIAAVKNNNDKIIVTATWDTDNTNIDLLIEEPGGRKVTAWSTTKNQLGGRMQVQANQGFGPEQYRNSAPYLGLYRILVAYEQADQAAIRDGTFVRVDIVSIQNGQEFNSTKTIFLKDELEVQEALLLNFQDRLATVPPPSFEQSVAQAKTLLRQAKYNEAKAGLERAGKQSNLAKEAERLFHISRAFAGLKQYQKAEEFNQAALVYKPRLLAAHFNNACYAVLSGDKKKAFHHLNLLSTAINTRGRNQRRYFVNLMMTDNDLRGIRTTPEFKNALNSLALAH